MWLGLVVILGLFDATCGDLPGQMLTGSQRARVINTTGCVTALLVVNVKPCFPAEVTEQEV